MEKLLLKLARQLDSLDEASLMALWSKYASMTSRFEPSKQWEESCLVFSLIQAKRWKNQLFNYNWSHQRLPPLKDSMPAAADGMANFDLESNAEPEPGKEHVCRILEFKPAKQEQSKNK